MAVDPPVRDPTGAGMGRTLPAAGGPYVVVGFVAMIAADPYESAFRRHTAFFNNGRRWTYANHNLRIRGGRQKGESEQ